MPTHYKFNYFFSDVEGINFRGIKKCFGDLLIYYNTLDGDDFVDCRCSRWNAANYSITVETWLKKDELNNLVTNIVPGAVGELYKILGEPTYYDKTWEGENTVILRPSEYTQRVGPSDWEGDNNSNLINMRRETIMYPKTISTHSIKNTEWIEVKIDGYISGGQDL